METLELGPSDICSPITNVNEVLNWKCDGKCWIHKHNVVDIFEGTSHLSSGCALDTRSKIDVFSEYKLPSNLLPKTVFCHDYKGGYVEDRFCNGSPNTNTYRFFNWAGIDIFMYFSHNLVTIPTQGWLNAGHVHGVPVLGTLISEWIDGVEVWNTIFESNENINLFAQKLAEICAHYKFDGYLLNIENVIPPDSVSKMVQFVALLKANLDHFCQKKTWLIWYDSVTTEGRLEWQNKLCSLNKPFFDTCDGIFLNYNWTPADLLESVELAGSRRLDVFVGVDVFGRNCYQDGGFNVDKALTFLRTLNMSVAIFAPGWTFEKLPPGEAFLNREMAFWKKCSPYLYTHGPAKLPFSTNFCQGVCFDKKSGAPLFNMGIQQYQPTGQVCCTDPSKESGCISQYFKDGMMYNGGCLKVTQASPNHSNTFHRIFTCDFNGAEDKPSILQVTLGLKNHGSDPATKFRIYFVLEDGASINGSRSVSMVTKPKGYRDSTKIGNLTVSASLVDFTAEHETPKHKIKVLQDMGRDKSDHSWHKVKLLLEVDAAESLTEVLLLPPPEGTVFWGFLKVKKFDTECKSKKCNK